MGKKILAFCCENSSYKAAAAVDDEKVLDAVEIMRLPCSGKIEIGLMLKCLEEGYPGVLVLGCPVDNCKYLQGNNRAKKRVQRAQALLEEAGIPEQLVHIDFLSSVDSHKFVEIVRGMQERIAEAARPQTAGASTEQ